MILSYLIEEQKPKNTNSAPLFIILHSLIDLPVVIFGLKIQNAYS